MGKLGDQGRKINRPSGPESKRAVEGCFFWVGRRITLCVWMLRRPIGKSFFGLPLWWKKKGFFRRAYPKVCVWVDFVVVFQRVNLLTGKIDFQTEWQTGRSRVLEGTLRIGSNNSLNMSGDLQTNASAVFDLNGFNQTVRHLSSPAAVVAGITSGFITNSATNTVTLSVGNNSTSDTTFHGVLQNNLGLTKLGAHTLTLTAANTYLGPTTISGGTLQIGAGSTSGSISSTSAVVNNGTLLVNRSDSYTLGNNISGSGALTHAGSGNLTVTGSNAFSGPVTVGSGSLTFSSAANLGNGSATNALNLNGSTLFSTGSSVNLGSLRPVNIGGAGATVDVAGSRQLEVSGPLGGVGDLQKLGAGTLVVSAASNGFSGTAQVNAGTLLVSGSLSNAAGVNVNNGGTLLLGGGANRIGDSAQVSLGQNALGGALGFVSGLSGASETIGTLTLNFDSILDLGSGNGNTFSFSSLVLGANFNSLKVYNWSGATYSSLSTADTNSPTQDRILFAGSSTGLTATDLSKITFYSDNGLTALGPTSEISFNGTHAELVPVPEPSTWIAAGLLLGLMGYRERRRIREVLSRG
jgi:autotransporter-associated beta strand protein